MNNESLQLVVLQGEASIRDAMLSFEKSALGVVLICDSEKRLLGLVTEGDIRRAILAGYGLANPVLTVANRTPVVGKTSMTRKELSDLLSDVVHCLPVVGEEMVLEDLFFADRRLRIPIATPVIGEKELRYVTDAVLSGWVSSRGKYIDLFEKEFARFCGTKHAVVVSNGTAALHLSLTAAGLGPGDEVIIPSLTFAATANAVLYCNAKPVMVDIDPLTWNINPQIIRDAITPSTRAILPVHLYGNPCCMDEIMAIAKEHGLLVIEDAAEAHGARYREKRVGSIGTMGCFSFYGNKILTTGEGGAVVTDDDKLADKLRFLRDHGMNKDKRYWHDTIGFNYRMTNLQAALGVAQLERWDHIIRAKNRIAAVYRKQALCNGLRIASTYKEAEPVCWLFTVVVDKNRYGMNRDNLVRFLQENGIDARPIFYPLPAMPPYFQEDWKNRYPAAASVSATGLSLPSSVEMNDSDLERISSLVCSFNKNL